MWNDWSFQCAERMTVESCPLRPTTSVLPRRSSLQLFDAVIGDACGALILCRELVRRCNLALTCLNASFPTVSISHAHITNWCSITGMTLYLYVILARNYFKYVLGSLYCFHRWYYIYNTVGELFIHVYRMYI